LPYIERMLHSVSIILAILAAAAAIVVGTILFWTALIVFMHLVASATLWLGRSIMASLRAFSGVRQLETAPEPPPLTAANLNHPPPEAKSRRPSRKTPAPRQ
jgi:hypothetical protein